MQESVGDIENEFELDLSDVDYYTTGKYREDLAKIGYRARVSSSCLACASDEIWSQDGEKLKSLTITLSSDYAQGKERLSGAGNMSYEERLQANPEQEAYLKRFSGYTSYKDPWNIDQSANGVIRHEAGHLVQMKLANTLTSQSGGKRGNSDIYDMISSFIDAKVTQAGLRAKPTTVVDGKTVIGRTAKNNYGYGWDTKQMSQYGATKITEAIAESISKPDYSKTTKLIYDTMKQLSKDIQAGKYTEESFKKMVDDELKKTYQRNAREKALDPTLCIGYFESIEDYVKAKKAGEIPNLDN